MEAAEAVDDDGAEAPDHDHRQQVVAPLHGQAATASEASTSMATIPKFDGFQRWRPSTRSTYFDVMEMAEQRA